MIIELSDDPELANIPNLDELVLTTGVHVLALGGETHGMHRPDVIVPKLLVSVLGLIEGLRTGLSPGLLARVPAALAPLLAQTHDQLVVRLHVPYLDRPVEAR